MNLGLLALRLVVGLLFAGHGAQKLFGAFGGSGIEGTAAGFAKGGLRPPRAHAWIAGLSELGGGLLLACGLLTPLAAAALIGVMSGAILSVHGPKGVWNTQGGYEYNLVLVAAAFALAAIGAGAWSLDNVLGLDLGGAGWGVAALAAGVLGGTLAVVLGRQQDARAHRPSHRHRHAGAH